MLKNNESPGQDNVTAELINYRGEQLTRLIKDLIGEIWKQEKILKGSSEAEYQFTKINGKSDCKTYRWLYSI